MRKFGKVVAFVLVIAMVLGLATGCKKGDGMSDAELANVTEEQIEKRAEELASQVVYSVDDFNITLQDVMYYVYKLEASGLMNDYYFHKNYGVSFWDSASDEDGTTYSSKYKQQILEKVMKDAVLYKAACKEDPTCEEDYQYVIETEVSDFFEQLTLPQRYRGGFTRETIKRNILIAEVAAGYEEKLYDGIDFTEEMAKKAANPDDYKEFKTEYLFAPKVIYDENNAPVELDDEVKEAYFEIVKEAKNYLSYAEMDIFEEGAEADIDNIGKKTDASLSQILEFCPAMEYGVKVINADGKDTDPDYYAACKDFINTQVSDIIETKEGYYFIRMINNKCTDTYDKIIQEAVAKYTATEYDRMYKELEDSFKIVFKRDIWNDVKVGNSIIRIEWN